MIETVPSNEFRPWLSNLILAFYGAVSMGLSFIFLFRRGYTISFVISIVIFWLFTQYHWKTFSKRHYGQKLEEHAIKQLTAALERTEGGAIEGGVMLKSGGDADAVVVVFGKKFNIEIKSVQTAQKVTSKHADQTNRAAAELFTIPIIWLPKGKNKHVSHIKGVRIFSGEAPYLVRFLESIA